MTWLGLSVSRTALRAVAVSRGRPVWVAERALSGVSEIPDAIAELATERPARVTRTRVVLAGDLVQTKLLQGLPRMRSTRLRAVVALQAGRWFLRNGTPLVTGATWIVPGERALAAAAEAGTVDRVLQGAARAGLTVEAIGSSVAACAAVLGDGRWGWHTDDVPERVVVRNGKIEALRRGGEDGLGETPLPAPPTLDPDMDRMLPPFVAARGDLGPILEVRALMVQRRTTGRRRTWRLALVAIGCWLLAIGTFEWRVRRAASMATAELATLAPVMDQALAVEQDIARAEDALDRIARARRTRSRDGALLGAITRALSDSAYLVSLRRDQTGRVTITGAAPSATRLVTALAAEAGIEGPTIQGSLSRDVTPRGVRERFRVAFTWHPGQEHR